MNAVDMFLDHTCPNDRVPLNVSKLRDPCYLLLSIYSATHGSSVQTNTSCTSKVVKLLPVSTSTRITGCCCLCPAETMGEAGLQLFLDAGCMVDNNVVNSLIKEVLLEKITSMAGEQTSRDRPQYHGSHDRHVTSDEETGSEVSQPTHVNLFTLVQWPTSS